MSTWLPDTDSRTVFDDASGDAVCIVSDLFEQHEMSWRCKLLAAAPDLRDAALAAVAWFSTQPGANGEWPDGHPMHKLICALMSEMGFEVQP